MPGRVSSTLRETLTPALLRGRQDQPSLQGEDAGVRGGRAGGRRRLQQNPRAVSRVPHPASRIPRPPRVGIPTLLRPRRRPG